jgi:hypothetical protein
MTTGTDENKNLDAKIISWVCFVAVSVTSMYLFFATRLLEGYSKVFSLVTFVVLLMFILGFLFAVIKQHKRSYIYISHFFLL